MLVVLHSTLAALGGFAGFAGARPGNFGLTSWQTDTGCSEIRFQAAGRSEGGEGITPVDP